MFFEEESINKGLQCPICIKKLQEPVWLPCEEFVCKSCIDNYIEENSDEKKSEFKCCLCNEDHLVPAKGFLKSKNFIVNFFLQQEPKNVNKGVLVERFKEDLSKCMNEISQIKDSFKNKEQIVIDYFESKRHEIHLVTESQIDEINKRSKELLNQVDEYEKEYLENLQTNSQAQSEIDLDVRRAEEFCKKWIDKLKLPETDENEVKKDRSELDNYLQLIDVKSQEQKHYIYNPA